MSGVTCIIPVYNDPSNLPRAVYSALNQDGCEKVVIVDDASSDNTLAIAKELEAKESRVEVFALPANRGQAFARNIGVMLADTHYITFLDADDEHLSGFYKVALKALDDRPKASLVRGSIEYVGELTNDDFEPDDDRLNQSLFVNPNTLIMRKHIFLQIGGFPVSNEFRGKYGGEDIAFSHILNTYFEGMLTKAPVLKYYVRSGGAFHKYISRTKWENGRIVILKNNADDEMFIKAFEKYVEDRKYCLGQSLASIKTE